MGPHSALTAWYCVSFIVLRKCQNLNVHAAFCMWNRSYGNVCVFKICHELLFVSMHVIWSKEQIDIYIYILFFYHECIPINSNSLCCSSSHGPCLVHGPSCTAMAGLEPELRGFARMVANGVGTLNWVCGVVTNVYINMKWLKCICSRTCTCNHLHIVPLMPKSIRWNETPFHA